MKPLDDVLLSQPFRPFPIRALNALGRGLGVLGRTPISLSADSLRAAASKQAGLSDFGPEDFEVPLAKLV